MSQASSNGTMQNRLSALTRSVTRAADRMPLRFSLLAIVVLECFVILAFQPGYETNDDVFMSMIAAGKGISSAPDEHLVFTNVIVGRALSLLYGALPDFPWYGWYLFLTHFVAQVGILYCALTVGRSPVAAQTSPSGKEDPSTAPADISPGELDASRKEVWTRCRLYLLYFALVEVPLLNVLQFTTTAFLASQAGIFLGLLAWERRARLPDASVAGPCCAAGALLFLGAIVRLESLAMALLVAAPIVLLLVGEASRRTLVPCGAVAVVAAALVALATAYDGRCYEHDPQWADFRGYNQLRGKFHDDRWTFYQAETAHVFASAGWSENDHTVIANWFSDDPELYSPAKLRQILAAYPWKEARDRTSAWFPTFREIVRNRAVLAIVLVLPLMVSVVGPGRARWALLGSAATALALVIVVTWSKKMPPERVYLPLLSFPLSVAIVAPVWRRKTVGGVPRQPPDGIKGRSHAERLWQHRPLLTQVMVVLFVIGIGMGIHRQCRRSMKIRQARGELRDFLAELRPTGHDLYVSWNCAFPLELISPLDSLRSWEQMPLLALAWPQRTPCQEATKRRFGISSVARALFEREDVVVIVAPNDRSSIGTFAKEHFDAHVEFVASRAAGKHFVAGRFQRADVPGNVAEVPTEATVR